MKIKGGLITFRKFKSKVNVTYKMTLKGRKSVKVIV